MADPNGWGIPLAQPDRQSMALVRPNQGPIPVKRKPGGRLVGPEQEDDAARLRKVAEDFEAVFLYQIIKQMRQTVEKEKLFHGGMGEDVFSEMMDEELSKKMAGRGSAGIADMLFKQLSRQYGIRENGAAKGTDGAGFPELSGAAESLSGRLRNVAHETKAVDAAAISRPER